MRVTLSCENAAWALLHSQKLKVWILETEIVKSQITTVPITRMHGSALRCVRSD